MDIYTLFRNIIVPGKRYFEPDDFNESLFCELTDGTKEPDYVLLKSIVLSRVVYTEQKASFSKVYNRKTGLLQFDVNTLSEDEYAFLESLVLHQLPELLHIRVADIL